MSDKIPHIPVLFNEVIATFSEISDELNYEILAHLSESITRMVIN